MQNSFIIPSDSQHYLFFFCVCVNLTFWCRLGWFILHHPQFFPTNIVRNYSQFVARSYSFQKFINFIAFQKRIADTTASRQMNFVKLMRDPYIALLDKTKLLYFFLNVCTLYIDLLFNLTCCTMTIWIDKGLDMESHQL